MHFRLSCLSLFLPDYFFCNFLLLGEYRMSGPHANSNIREALTRLARTVYAAFASQTAADDYTMLVQEYEAAKANPLA